MLEEFNEEIMRVWYAIKKEVGDPWKLLQSNFGVYLLFHCLKTDVELLLKDFIRWKRIVLGQK